MVCLSLSQTFNGFAIGLGNIILISSTSCLTIVFTCIMSPIILKEQFVWIRDGVTILLVGSGSATAVSQQPQHLPTYTDADVNKEMLAKLSSPLAIIFFSTLIFLIVLRNILMTKIRKILIDDFYTNIKNKYIELKKNDKEQKKVEGEIEEEFEEPPLRLIIKLISTNEMK